MPSSPRSRARKCPLGVLRRQATAGEERSERRSRDDLDGLGAAGGDASITLRHSRPAQRHPREGEAEAARPHLHRPDRSRRREERPDPASRYRGHRAFLRLGYQVVRPLAGALPDDFTESQLYHVALDRARKVWRLPWGQKVPLAPFFGVMGTALLPLGHGLDAAAAAQRRQSRQQGTRRRHHALSADLRRRRVVLGRRRTRRARRWRTVHHGRRTGLTGTFRLALRDDMKLEWPLAETPTHMITMAFDPDLDDCVVVALRQMLDLTARAPVSTATRPMRLRASPPICASRRSQWQQGGACDAR